MNDVVDVRILVVDGSLTICKQIERVLANTEFESVGSAIDGTDALVKFKQLRPQVVTMGLTMPKLSGVDTIKLMMEIDPEVKILVISAMRDRRTAMQAIRMGGYGFLPTPFSANELTQSLTVLFDDVVAEF